MVKGHTQQAKVASTTLNRIPPAMLPTSIPTSLQRVFCCCSDSLSSELTTFHTICDRHLLHDSPIAACIQSGTVPSCMVRTV